MHTNSESLSGRLEAAEVAIKEAQQHLNEIGELASDENGAVEQALTSVMLLRKACD